MDDKPEGHVTLDNATFLDMVTPRPNPDDWTDTAGAAALLDRTRPTVYDFADKGTITRYLIGHMPAFWVPELKEVRRALDRLKR